MDGQIRKPDCAISQWVYPGLSNCINALITIGRYSGREAKVRANRSYKGYNCVRNPQSLPPICQTCEVMKVANNNS